MDNALPEHHTPGVIHADDVKELCCEVNPEDANLCHETRLLGSCMSSHTPEIMLTS